VSAPPIRLTALEPATTAGVRELLHAATEADGSAPLGEHGVRRLAGEGPHLLVRDRDDRPVGYAQLEQVQPGQWSAELAVHPAARRRGVGASLVRALLEQSGAADGSGQTLQVWAHGELPGAVALAGSFGFRQVRALWQLRRGLAEPELGPVQLPEGVRLRTFVVGQDESEFLRVNNAAFDWHPEQGGWDVAQLREREADPWFDPPGFLLAVEADSGRLLGYHWTKVHTEPERIGEVYVLGVDPAAHGRGLGGALTLAGLHYLRERGLADVLLYVEADNHAAVRVYQKLGFTHWHTDAAYAVGP
jgi:mycothiol synthase